MATRRPAHPIGWLLLAAGVAGALQLLCGEYAATTLVLGPGRLPYGPTAAWLSYMLQPAAVIILLFLLLQFPTGRLLSSRWRIVAWVGVCGFSLGLPYTALRPGPFDEDSLLDNPFGVDVAILGPLNAVGLMLIIFALLGALLSLVVRFVRSHGEERQQIKWFVSVAVLEAYDRSIGLELSEVAVDCCITKAPCGGEKAGRSSVDRGKPGIKRSTAVDGEDELLASESSPQKARVLHGEAGTGGGLLGGLLGGGYHREAAHPRGLDPLPLGRSSLPTAMSHSYKLQAVE